MKNMNIMMNLYNLKMNNHLNMNIITMRKSITLMKWKKKNKIIIYILLITIQQIMIISRITQEQVIK